MQVASDAGPRPPERALAALRWLLTGLLLLQALGGVFPGPHLWGVNHLAYLSPPWRIAVPLLGLAALWTPLGQRLGRWLTDRAEPALLGRRWVVYGLIPFAGMVAFWLLRCRIHFLGDGWLLGELIARGAPFHGFDFVDYNLHARLFSLLRLNSEPQAFQLFAVMSTVAGGGYLAAVGWTARAASADRGVRILLYALLIFAAPVQIFMGYVECYSFLAVFMLLFLGALMAHYRGGVTAPWVGAAFGAALFFHLDALFLAPLLLPLIVWPPRGVSGPFGRRLARVAIPIATLFALAVLFMLLEGYNRTWFELDFIKLRQNQRLLAPLTGDEGLGSWRRWLDSLNLLALLAPLGLALIAAALPVLLLRARALAREATVPLLGAGWLTLLLLVVHMKLGVMRDWDLLAAQAPVFIFAGVSLWLRLGAGTRDGRLIGWCAATAVLLSVPWFWLNAGEERSLTRFREVVAGQPRFARAYAHEEIGKYYRKLDRIPEALEEYRICVAIFPGNPRFHGVLGSLQYNSGDRAAAFETFRRAYAVDSTYALSLEMLAYLHAEREEFEPALFYSRKLAADPKEKSRSAALHGFAAEQLGQTREAMDAYTRAIAKDTKRLDLLERIGALALMERDFARAERAFRGVLATQATASAKVGLVAAIWEPLRNDPRQWISAENRARMGEALAAAEALVSAGDTSAAILAWRDGLRAALGGR